MSPQTPELDPVAIRKALVKHRDARLPFDEAWLRATNHHGVSDDDRTLYKFMRDNFRAAYDNDKSSKGRCLVPERDVSNALVVAQRPTPTPDHERCQSGDGCDHPATRGRFGKTFCEHHGTDLERLAEKFNGGRAARGARGVGEPYHIFHTPRKDKVA